ncbi:MAG: cytochrome C [bacterium]
MKIFLVFAFILIMLSPILLQGFRKPEEPELVLPKGKCVQERDFMRKNHMELLKEAREKAVREGIRGSFTLTSCILCHHNRENFCNRCHNFAGVKPLCFNCHYYP